MAPGSTIPFVVLLVLGVYMPIATVLFVRRRKYPSIRFGSPIQMAIANTCAMTLSIGTMALLLGQEHVSCIVYYIFLYVSVNLTLVGLLISELSTVLTFQLTEEIADHHDHDSEEAKALSKKRIKYLRAVLSFKGLAMKWLSLIFFWIIIPLLVLGSSAVNAIPKSELLNDSLDSSQMVTLTWVILVQTAVFLLLYLILFWFLSRVMDNFGLCARYRLMGYLLSVLFILYLLCIILHSSSWVRDYAAQHIILSLFGHSVAVAQIVIPLLASRKERSFADATIVQTSKINMLEAFLETADGYHAFSEFARIQFSYENAVAWKACSDFRKHGGNSIVVYDTYIKAQSVMETNIPGTLRKYYYDVFEKSRKGHKILGYESALDKDLTIFDRFREAILKLMVLDTLPRFQVHPLGKGWQPFVEAQESHFVLNHLIGAIDQPENIVMPFDGHVQKVVDRVRRASSRTDSKNKRDILQVTRT